MPGGALRAAAAAAGGAQHLEAAPLPGQHDLWLSSAFGGAPGHWPHGPRRHHTSAAAQAGGLDQASGGGDDKSKDSGGKDAKTSSDSILIYTSPTGKTVEVSGESVEKCQASCADAEELKDENMTGINQALAAANGGERALVADCKKFCEAEFVIECFPGDSNVIVRDRGCVRIADLRVGDDVLALGGLGSDAGGQWELLFDTVINWLHHSPDREGEVLQIRHEAGQVQLTASHLLFVRKPGRAGVVPCRADEVRLGDRLLVPWIDGSIAEPAVLRIDHTCKRGLYAPLVSCGTVFVDGTAASCYGLPDRLHASPLVQRVARLADGKGFHAAAHAVFLPLRLLHSACGERGGGPRTAKATALPGAGEERKQLEPSSRKEVPIHPYAWVLYILASSFLT